MTNIVVPTSNLLNFVDHHIDDLVSASPTNLLLSVPLYLEK